MIRTHRTPCGCPALIRRPRSQTGRPHRTIRRSRRPRASRPESLTPQNAGAFATPCEQDSVNSADKRRRVQGLHTIGTESGRDRQRPVFIAHVTDRVRENVAHHLLKPAEVAIDIRRVTDAASTSGTRIGSGSAWTASMACVLPRHGGSLPTTPATPQAHRQGRVHTWPQPTWSDQSLE